MNRPVDFRKIKTCARCGHIYESQLKVKYCPTCNKTLEEQLKSVRKFLDAHEGATADELSVALSIDRKQIDNWARENRIEFTEESGDSIPCQKCRQPIRVGKYCKDCQVSMKSELESIYIKKEVKKASDVAQKDRMGRMHFLNRDQRGKR